MSYAGGKKESREIALGDDFGPVTVSVNDVALVIDADGKTTLKASSDATIITNGNITAYSRDGNVTAYTKGTVQLKAPAPEQVERASRDLAGACFLFEYAMAATKQACHAYKIGDVLPDGWVVGPRSPKTGIVMAIEPVSGALDGYKTWHQGEDHAKELREKGHANARQPSADNNNDELKAIYNGVVKAGRNGNAKLNKSASHPYGGYWSGTTVPCNRAHARMQYFHDGNRSWGFKDDAYARVRCVRDEPGLALA